MKRTAESVGRVFILSEYVDAVRNSTGYYWAKIIHGLADLPGGVRVISTRTSARLCPARDHVGYVEVNDSRGYQKDRVVSRILGQLTLSFGFCVAVLRNVRRGDVVFSGTNPAFVVIFIALLKQVVGFRWVLLVHDVFPENLVPAGIIKRNSVGYALLKTIFDAVYRRADRLIAIGRDMQLLLSEKTRGAVEVAYIPNWVDSIEVTQATPTPNARSSGQKVFQFFGNMGRVQGLETLLEAIRELRPLTARFTFVGGGASESVVRSFIEANPELPIEMAPPVPFSRNNEALFACDIAIISLRTGMRGLAVPSKTYFSMAADKPVFVIGDAGSELHELMREHTDIGWFCEAGNVESIRASLQQAIDSDLGAMHGRPRLLAQTIYSYEAAMEKYRGIIARLREHESQ
jgi:glycosyltransferase involved in cell wall biosynthesis